MNDFLSCPLVVSNNGLGIYRMSAGWDFYWLPFTGCLSFLDRPVEMKTGDRRLFSSNELEMLRFAQHDNEKLALGC